MSGKGCPPVTVNIDKIVETVKESILSEKPVEAEVHAMDLKVAESPVKADEFVLGYVTIPTAVNFVTKLMRYGMPIKADLALSRGIAMGITFGATVLTGGKSFLLGAFLGQFPSTLDAIADSAVKAIVPPEKQAALKAEEAAAIVPTPSPAAKGIGATDEAELRKLRADLMRMQGARGRSMEGVLVVR